MKALKKIVKVIVALAIVATIAVGIYFLVKNGLNYPENGVYKANNIVEEATPYMIKMGISAGIILVYLMIKYSKLGVVKVGIGSVVTMAVGQALVISVMAIAKAEINRIFFAMFLLVFALSAIMLTAVYESKLKKSTT